MEQPDKNEILSFLNYIVEEKNKKLKDSYNLIKQSIEKYSILFPSFTIPKNKLLYRARVHNNGEVFFKNQSDLSHIINESEVKEFGRANEPGQSIFYCSDKSNVAFFEVSKIAKKLNTDKKEITTTGVWQVQEDIRVGYIPINESIKGLNVTADGLQDSFEKVISKYNFNDYELLQKVLNIFSKEFIRDAKNDQSNYWISCAFANYIYNSSGYDTSLKQIIKSGGIIYTSVMHNTQGVNIALKPKYINEKKIKLVKVFRKIMERLDNNFYKDTEVKEAKRIEDDKIYWS